MSSFGIFVTILLFYGFSKLFEKGKKFYLNPILLSIVTISLFLKGTGISYDYYMKSARFLFFLLGPAVVSLSIPLYKERETIKSYAREIVVGILFGGMLAALSAVLIAKLLGADKTVVLSIAPKSVTTAIAIGISDKIGGIPALTAVLVIITGIMGNAVGVEVLNLAKVKDRVARGLGMGVTSHGLGTARIILDDELSGAVSGLSIALNGIYTSFMLPYLMVLLMRFFN